MSEASTAASPPAGRGLQVLSAPVVVPAAAAVPAGARASGACCASTAR